MRNTLPISLIKRLKYEGVTKIDENFQKWPNSCQFWAYFKVGSNTFLVIPGCAHSTPYTAGPKCICPGLGLPLYMGHGALISYRRRQWHVNVLFSDVLIFALENDMSREDFSKDKFWINDHLLYIGVLNIHCWFVMIHTIHLIVLSWQVY